MPAEQRGQPYRTGDGWGIRYYDEDGKRCRRSGFASRTEARRWFDQIERPRQHGLPTAQPDRTFAVFVDEYLAAHAPGREPTTMFTLRHRLGYATATFGDLTLRELETRAVEVARWRGSLPEGVRYGCTAALRQALEAAVRWGYCSQNAAKLAGPNPQPRRPEIEPYTREQVDAIAEELGPEFGPLVVFAAETGLRPSEWIALERCDFDRDAGVVLVERTHTAGRTKGYGKTDRSRRRVPLSSRAFDAVEQLPARIDSRLVFPAPRGGHLNLHNWRRREWTPAVEASGVGHGSPYTLRHTFATWALSAGISIFELARYMGTSVAMIDRTYGHLAHGSEDQARAKLDRLGQERATEQGHRRLLD